MPGFLNENRKCENISIDDDHIDTSLLESAILSPDALGKESLARIRAIWMVVPSAASNSVSVTHVSGVEDELKGPPTERDRQAAGRILPRGL